MKNKIEIFHVWDDEKPNYIFVDHFFGEIELFYLSEWSKMFHTVGVWRIKYKQN